MKNPDVLGLPLNHIYDIINNEYEVEIIETKGTNAHLNKDLNELRVINSIIKDNVIKIIVCAF